MIYRFFLFAIKYQTFLNHINLSVSYLRVQKVELKDECVWIIALTPWFQFFLFTGFLIQLYFPIQKLLFSNQ